MTRRIVTTLLASAAALAASTLPAVAAEPRFGPETGDYERIERFLDARADRLAEALELSAEQRGAFDRLRAEKLEGVRPTLEKIRANGERLRAQLDERQPDPTAIGNAVLELHRMRAELRATKDEFERELATILTPEQRFAMEALERSRPFGEHRRRGPGLREPGERGFGRRGGRPAH